MVELEKEATALTEGRESSLRNEADKFDEGKVKWSLLPYAELEDVARVFEYGASKYGQDNWRGSLRLERWWDSIQRHLVSWKCGEELDESGHHHLAHVVAATLQLLYHAKRKNEK